MWERALRRASLRVMYTEGFSPRPKMHFGLALSTGHESMAEYITNLQPLLDAFWQSVLWWAVRLWLSLLFQISFREERYLSMAFLRTI